MSIAFIQRGGLWVLLQFLIMFAIAMLGLGARHVSDHSLRLPAAWLFFAASVLCGSAGIIAMGRNLTAFPKPIAQGELVQRGIYRIIRHPLYTSLIAVAIGWSLLRASWPAFFASLALAILLDRKARKEEQWLRLQFPDYQNYQQRVPRFIPWLY